MRLVSQFNKETKAHIFSDHLYVQGIDNQVRQDTDGTWEVWVIEEDHIPDAETMLKEFLNDPDNPKYEKETVLARKKREQVERSNIEYDKKYHSRQRIFTTLKGAPFQLRSVTGVLIIMSVLVTLVSFFGSKHGIIMPLLITEYKIKGAYITWSSGLREVTAGQVWRLVTPILVHFGLMHILFNMMWLKDLGSMIEEKHGPVFFLIMVLVMAISSNLGQFLASGPSFGGMSGVVYGLLGYAWMRGKYDPGSGLYVSKHNVILMIVWFFLCLTGLMGNIGNASHGVGLGIGIIWGFISAKLKKRF